MSELFNSETMWLTATNVLLGLVTVVCIAAVVRVAVKEWYARSAFRVRIPLEEDTHAFDMEGLGITMADGGERIDERRNFVTRPTDDEDPPNIIRSIN